MKNFSLSVLIAALLGAGMIFSQPSSCLGEPVPGGAALDDAERYMRSGDYAKAEGIFLNSASGSNTDLRRESLYGLGRVYYNRGDYDQARVNLELAAAITSDPAPLKESKITHTLAGIYVHLSYLDMQRRDYHKAILTLQKAADAGLADVNKNSYLGSNIYLLIARNYINLGDVDSARKYLDKSLSLSIENAGVASSIRQVSLIEKGRCALLSGDYGNAIALFEQTQGSKKTNETSLSAYIGCVTAGLLRGDRADALNKYASRLASLRAAVLPARAWYLLGAVNFKDNKLKEAKDCFSKAVAIADGTDQASRKKFFSANFDLNSALAHYGLGVIYESEKQDDRALIEMNKTVEFAKAAAGGAFYERVCAAYLRIAAQKSICRILEAQGMKDSAAQEAASLADYVKSISPGEKALIEQKLFGVYIEGKLRL